MASGHTTVNALVVERQKHHLSFNPSTLLHLLPTGGQALQRHKIARNNYASNVTSLSLPEPHDTTMVASVRLYLLGTFRQVHPRRGFSETDTTGETTCLSRSSGEAVPKQSTS